MKHTALEWFVEEFFNHSRISTFHTGQQEEVITLKQFEKIVDQAKQIEREQMISAFSEGMRCQNFDPNRGRAEQYFNETFKTNEK
jgi:hypothetical protein